ncbi:MAG: hypothetical protein QM767_11425 [Anaeromyxobacter sp.]
MTLIVDIRDWLDERGSLPLAPPRLRSSALRIATFIEYGGTVPQLEGRETMVPCKQRPRRKPCLGLMWVMKRSDDRIQAFCMFCRNTEAIISGWQGTEWAEGPMEPAPMTDD